MNLKALVKKDIKVYYVLIVKLGTVDLVTMSAQNALMKFKI